MQDEYTLSRAGERLRSSIEGRGETLAAFSRRCGVPYRSVQDYVGGKSRPGFEQLAKFAEAGLDVTYILTGSPTGELDCRTANNVELAEGVAFNISSYRQVEIASLLDAIDRGFELRDWIAVWDFADGYVPGVKEFPTDPKVRQGAVLAVAQDICAQLGSKMKALGWIKG